MNLAQAPAYTLPQLPSGPTLTQGTIMGILTSIANFLIAAGIILSIITIVVSGIMYFAAGSDTEAKKAKGWFRNGIIGAFIILAVGVIILTIYNIVVTGTFFGGPGVPIVPGGPGPGPAGPIAGGPGSPCTYGSPNACAPGHSCNISSNICNRDNGNLEGEICKNDSDCTYKLECKGGIFGVGQKTCKNP